MTAFSLALQVGALAEERDEALARAAESDRLRETAYRHNAQALKDWKNEFLKALVVPEVWTSEEAEGLRQAFNDAREKHGHTEALFAAAAWLLRHRASIFEARTEAVQS